jgi:LysM repeat protein/ABC-type branched-subunit amino acid transport system substrate-binding protein
MGNINSFVLIGRSRIVLLLIFSFLFIGLSVAQTDRSKIIIDGKTFYLYKVKKSEGLYRISKKFGVTQNEIIQVNPDVVQGLKEGELLKIPVISGRNSTYDEMLGSGKYIYHTVEKGQTVFYISHKYNVPKSVIYENNRGSDKQLIEGTIIKIPVDKIESNAEEKGADGFVMHKVRSKETLYGLAKKYNVQQSEIVKANPALKNGVLPVGSMLRIPVRKSGSVVGQPKYKETTTETQVKLEDEKYEYYKIQPGETLYSIAKKLSADVHEVEAANIDVDKDNLPVGYMLRIPKSSIHIKSVKHISNDDELFVKHKVRRKETLFSISRKYNVDIDIIRKINSTVNLSKLKKGTFIKIPTQKWFEEVFYREEVKKEEKPEIVHKTKEDSIAYADCISYNYYDSSPLLKVGLFLPFDVADSKKANIISEENDNGEIIEKEREEKIISNKSKVFLEFYEGFLMALDSLKKENTNIELFVFDTNSDSTDKIMEILHKPGVADLDMIIGPAFAINLTPVADFAKANDIKLIYPFSTINPELERNPEIFQVSPVDTLLFDVIENEMLKSINGKRVIVIRTKENSAYENRLSNDIKEKIYWNDFKDGVKPDYVEYRFVQGELNGLEELFIKDVENIIIIPSKNEAYVSGIVTTIAGIVKRRGINATLWGLPDWLRFQSLKSEDIHQLNGHIFSSYRMVYNDPETEAFIAKYREWYKTEPMAISPYFQKASVRSNFSRYGIWGYDVTYYFINALKKYGKNFEYCLDGYNPHLIQSNFKFKRVSNWGGMYNTGLFILNFTPEYELKIKKIE